MYDIIVVGGGHAGCEAALAASRLQMKTILITGNFQMVAAMSCNPSIGGPAKGIVVREIDALGGEMGRNIDKTHIQMKMLNMSKGPAVRALRAQADKIEYPKEMLKTLRNQENLVLMEAFVESLIITDNIVQGVKLENGEKYFSKAVILTTGTYLNSRVLVGHLATQIGPDEQKTTLGISNQLKELGFDVIRLKTGTPPRLKKSTIDYSVLTPQSGDNEQRFFSFYQNSKYDCEKQEDCYLTYTSKKTHQIILENLSKSAMYGGIVEGIGPRYCPSIEDKVVRFNDKERHQIFLEPESKHTDSIYIQGLSTSMPIDIQDQLIHSIPGLENAHVYKYAYAIEYDAINPIQLDLTLETKRISHLFCAGQINGTSGYEEAACQGLMAGINACLKIQNKSPFILKRNEAYIGVLIDDLVTKGTMEPYRLLTSRAEYRLLLRHDNADLRLSEYGYQIGLLNETDYAFFLGKKLQVENLLNLFKEEKVLSNKENNEYLLSRNSSPLVESTLALDLLKRPEINFGDLKYLLNIDFRDEVLEQVEIQTKYEGYINKAYRQVEKWLKVEKRNLPLDIDYKAIKNLALEARDKLMKIKPRTIGQASRISGVNPSDIAILLMYLEMHRGKNEY